MMVPMRSRLGSIIFWVGFVALMAVYGVGWQYHLPLGPLLSILIVGLGALMLARYLQRPNVETPAPDAKAASSVGVNMFVLCVAAVIVPAATTDNLPIGKIIGYTVGLLVVVAVVFFLRMMQRMRRDAREFTVEQQGATAALASGDFVRAGGIWARWTKTDSPAIRSHANHGLATILIHRGEFDEAMKLIGECKLAWQYLDAAIVHVLRGELDDGEVALRSLEDSNPYAELPAAIWNCRSGATDHVVTDLRERWPSIESQLTAQHLRPLQIVRAFAEASDVRQAGVSAMSLANLRPHYKGEFAYLGKEWPEMAAFLAANGLD